MHCTIRQLDRRSFRFPNDRFGFNERKCSVYAMYNVEYQSKIKVGVMDKINGFLADMLSNGQN